MSTNDLLIELGTEELPPKSLTVLSDAFCAGIAQGLADVGLTNDTGSPLAYKAYASPRRLALVLSDVPLSTPEKHIEKLGPNIKAAFDAEGKPTKAASGFAAGCGVGVSELGTKTTDKGDRLVHLSVEQGKPTSDVVQSIIDDVLGKLPIPKRMRWGARRDEFIRPVKWLLALHGEQAIDLEVYGVPSGTTTRAHRFMANVDGLNRERELPISHAAHYATELLDKGCVVADSSQRKQMIRDQLAQCALSLGGQIVVDEDLLEEVTSLVEWPHCLSGAFDEEFLALPKEALISSMRSHQKYFHVLNADGELLPSFVTVANIDSHNPAEIIAGNERVIRPRLADAQFFYANDAKQPLDNMAQRLNKIVFQDQLGSVGDKAQRLSQLAAVIGEHNAAAYQQSKVNCARAALLCKADLVSDMVGEFADLQGVMGRYYANEHKEDAEVANAIEEHYLPRFAGDQLPSTNSGIWLSMADRIDTLVGLFGIGQPPSGSKDPFALRRAALGLLRVIIEKDIDVSLSTLIKASASLHLSLTDSDVESKVLTFILERLRAWYADQGVRAETLLAVLNTDIDNPLDINRRVQAVTAFASLEQADALAAANKRVRNLLAKQDNKPASAVRTELFADPAETLLADAIGKQQASIGPLLDQHEYAKALTLLAELRGPVDAFFDNVMVLDEDPDIRANRLALLQQLQDLFGQIADISQLAS